jgi:hypothetical protein
MLHRRIRLSDSCDSKASRVFNERFGLRISRQAAVIQLRQKIVQNEFMRALGYANQTIDVHMHIA